MVIGTRLRLALTWSILSAVTLASWWIGSRHHRGPFELNGLITTSVLLIAALKVRIVFMEFMEVRQAPALLRNIADIWLGLLMTVLLATYAIGTNALH